MHEPASDERPERTDAGEAPHLDESVRRLGAAGRATLASARESGRALRTLFWADLALARSALGRALAWLALAIVVGASAWLLAMGVLIASLHALGASWLVSASAAAVLSLVLAGIAAWRVSVFFDHAGLHATRRQLARWGIGDESEDDEDAARAEADKP